MGLPFVVLNMVSAVLFKDLGISDSRIAFWTSLIMWPWTVKFLWSPLLELHHTKKFWVVSSQLACGLLFCLVSLCLHAPSFFSLSILLFALIAFCGATHDIAADGVYMDTLSSSQQARYIGVQGAFYNLAKLIASGGLVWCAGWFFARFVASGRPSFAASRAAWSIILLSLGFLMFSTGLWHSHSLPSDGRSSQHIGPGQVPSRLHRVISSFFSKRHIWFYLLFIILYRLGEGFVMKIVPLFLKADLSAGGLGLSNQQIGLYYGTFGAGAFLLGSWFAGRYIAARGLKRTLFSLVCIFNIPFAIYALLAWFQPRSMWLIGGGIVLEYFGYGFGFVRLTLFMMQQVAPGPHRMAHYAFASGIMNLSVMCTGMVSGFLCDAVGYRRFFLVVLLATIPVFIAARFLPFSYSDQIPSNDGQP